MAPQPKGEKSNPSLTWVRIAYGSHMREVAKLQEDLKILDEKITFLRGEALHHQIQLSSGFEDTRIMGPSSGKLVLPQRYVESLEKRKAAQDTISISGMSKLEVTVEGIEGEDPAPEEEWKDVDTLKVPEINIPAGALVKLFKLEGKAGNIAYATNFSVYYNWHHEGGQVAEVHDLKCSSKGVLVQQVTRPQRLLLPKSLHHITSDLYFLQMLQSEREDIVSQLESEVPNFMVERGLEPLVIIFNPTRGHELKIQWNIIWDAKNERLKNDISIDCTDKVAKSYSRTKHIYPYLIGQDQLCSSQDVANFIEAFEV